MLRRPRKTSGLESIRMRPHRPSHPKPKPLSTQGEGGIDPPGPKVEGSNLTPRQGFRSLSSPLIHFCVASSSTTPLRLQEGET